MEWKNIYRGMIMGITELIPGVSSGTIAVILGIYDRLIAAINGIFSRTWRKQLLYLIPLGVGIGVALFSFSHLMNFLLANYESITYYFFLGLIIGVLPFLFRESNRKGRFKVYHYLLIGLGIVIILLFPENSEAATVIQELSLSTYILLFFSGILASAAMILPGISGSFIFVVLGVYKTVIQAVSTFDLKILIVVAIGIGIGILAMGKIIHYFLKHYHTATFSVILGLVIGSVFVIFPGWSENVSTIVYSLIVFAAGLFVAFILGKVEY